jgi:hypothetical protein
MVHNQMEVVPAPFTHKVPVPKGTFSPPNALRLVRHVGELHPHFPYLPHTFAIPGHSLAAAQAFFEAMRATVRWNEHRPTPNPLTEETIIRDSSFGCKHYFKIEYTFPCKGFVHPPLNSHKPQHTLAWCGCTSRFSIVHHIETDSLQVTWFWKHNHDPNSREDMIVTRAPIAVENWLESNPQSYLHSVHWNSKLLIL